MADDEQVLQDDVVYGRAVFATLRFYGVHVEPVAVEHEVVNVNVCRIGQADRVVSGAGFDYGWRSALGAVDLNRLIRRSAKVLQGQSFAVCAGLEGERVAGLQGSKNRPICRWVCTQLGGLAIYRIATD
jgi:hypothetical protein